METSPFLQCTRIAIDWALAMFWHLWRIATLRPAFNHMADDAKTLLSFGSVFVAAGLLRHWVFGHQDLFGAIGTMAMWALLLIVLFERSNRSSTLVAACMGVSAIVDLVLVAAETSGLVSGLGRLNAVFYVEVLLMLVQRHIFLRRPDEVRARGYRPARDIA